MVFCVLDIGSVSVRLGVYVWKNEMLRCLHQESTITQLGLNLDKTGKFCLESIQGTADAVRRKLRKAQNEYQAEYAVCILTSAARRAQNYSELKELLEKCNLAPQVISGEVEAQLTFEAVSSDFLDEDLVVCDSGGGSTELIYGKTTPRGSEICFETSLEVGAQRICDSFLGSEQVCDEVLQHAHQFVSEAFDSEVQDAIPDNGTKKLVCVGGSATTIVSLLKQLEPYDPSQVHLSEVSQCEIEALEAKLAGLTCKNRAKLPGIQPKRAEVIVGGICIILEVMRKLGCKTLMVSETDLLWGIARRVVTSSAKNVDNSTFFVPILAPLGYTD